MQISSHPYCCKGYDIFDFYGYTNVKKFKEELIELISKNTSDINCRVFFCITTNEQKTAEKGLEELGFTKTKPVKKHGVPVFLTGWSLSLGVEENLKA